MNKDGSNRSLGELIGFIIGLISVVYMIGGGVASLFFPEDALERFLTSFIFLIIGLILYYFSKWLNNN